MWSRMCLGSLGASGSVAVARVSPLTTGVKDGKKVGLGQQRFKEAIVVVVGMLSA